MFPGRAVLCFTAVLHLPFELCCNLQVGCERVIYFCVITTVELMKRHPHLMH